MQLSLSHSQALSSLGGGVWRVSGDGLDCSSFKEFGTVAPIEFGAVPVAA